ncbi:hypothetical protein GCM10018790_44690 [Kitasatospora xanthocidica]|uniref:hypothetical protein n=1 Tax=Kitasatospora xanthocidica TaxID=83382 RepID=UPI0016769260|nr:hypothetical protein [Kitasatospora xanthocidica]GHF61818.1 hypothetical protein GCM10018790_44690 [Kitasatospora xanthocidica]
MTGRRLRYFFEAGVVGTALWPDDVESPYGYPAELDLLPISAALAAELDRLSSWFQSSLDWDDPGGPSPWSRDEGVRFEAAARAALAALRGELGPEWTVVDRLRPPR